MIKLIIFVFTLHTKGAFEVHQFDTIEDCRYRSEIMIEQWQIKLPTQVFCCGVKCEVIASRSSAVSNSSHQLQGLPFSIDISPSTRQL